MKSFGVLEAFGTLEEQSVLEGERLSALELTELPKRLFRNLSTPTRRSLPPSLLPFLVYLFDTYSPSPSSHKGYPLCASITNHPISLPLTQFLLDKGANPGLNDGYAVQLAVGKKDLALVKKLIEVEWEKGDDKAEGGRKKRRRTEDRTPVTSKMCMFFSLFALPHKIVQPFWFLTNMTWVRSSVCRC